MVEQHQVIARASGVYTGKLTPLENNHQARRLGGVLTP